MKSLFHIVFLCFVCIGNLSYADSYEDLPTGFKLKWEALLHYAYGKSSISSKSDFFLSPVGHFSPGDELLANLNELESNSKYQCRFPARYYLLTGNQPSQICEDFQEYKKYVSPEKISLVFASESTTSPISSMGHVFLVLEGKNALGLNKRHATAFVADTAENGNLFVGFLTDSLVGRYVLNPYDDSIYTYISEEHRSLWEYELFLTNEEKLWLYLHLYELKANLTQYSFFSHNCAVGLNRILSVASKDFQYGFDRYYVTPIEYTKFVNNTERVTTITLRPSEEDKLRVQNGVDLNPLKTIKTSRVLVSTVYDSTHKEGIHFEFLPFFSDVEEHKLETSALGQVQFLKISGTGYKGHFFIDNVTLVNLRSLPNLQISSLKPSFGIELHGDIDSNETKLYPDFYIGTGFSWGDKGLRPFYSIDVGMQLIPSQSRGYVRNQFGLAYSQEQFGLAMLSYSNVVTTKGHYRNYKNNFHLSYSNQVLNDFSLSLKVDYFDLSKGDDIKQIKAGVSYRF